MFRTFALAVGCDPSAAGPDLLECLQVFYISTILKNQSSRLSPLSRFCQYACPQNVPLHQLISQVRLFDHEDKVGGELYF